MRQNVWSREQSPDTTRTNTKKYAELVDTLKAYFKPQSLVIVERFRFYCQDQQTGETTAAYVVALKHQVSRCKFEAFLEEALRDRLVCGLRSEAIQKKLLLEKDLAFKRACDVAKAMELVAKDTAELASQSQPRESTLHQLATKTQGEATRGGYRKPPYAMSKGEQGCYRCGGKHNAQKCWHKKTKCHGYAKVGHLRHMCKNNPRLETKVVGS